jgi:hypothetical protein
VTAGLNEEDFMDSVYSYRTGVSANSGTDLTGFEVEASDGHIGKIDEATYDTSASYVVVDTGFWIFGKKRLVPAGVVDRIDPVDQKVYVRMTKDQIKNAPDFDPDRNQSGANQDQYRNEVGTYYTPYSQ